MAFAQAGTIGVWADPNGCSCDLNNTAGFMYVHVIHSYAANASGCRFSIRSWGVPLTFIGQEFEFRTVGYAGSGISVFYDACLSSPVYLGYIIFMGTSVTKGS